MTKIVGILALLAVLAFPPVSFAGGGGEPGLKQLAARIIEKSNKVLADMERLAKQAPSKRAAANVRATMLQLTAAKEELLLVLKDPANQLARPMAESFLKDLSEFDRANKALFRLLDEKYEQPTS